MIVGIGVDTIETSRIEKAISREHFIQRTYTEGERAYCESKGNNRVQSYAGMFAAKEAAVKALGSGFRGFGPEAVEIYHDEEGAPHLRFLHGAGEKAAQLQIGNMHLSISHDHTKAIAFVILEKKEAGS